jgi:hypothetical protein
MAKENYQLSSVLEAQSIAIALEKKLNHLDVTIYSNRRTI